MLGFTTSAGQLRWALQLGEYDVNSEPLRSNCALSVSGGVRVQQALPMSFWSVDAQCGDGVSARPAGTLSWSLDVAHAHWITLERMAAT
jgi:hypothetical protein